MLKKMDGNLMTGSMGVATFLNEQIYPCTPVAGDLCGLFTLRFFFVGGGVVGWQVVFSLNFELISLPEGLFPAPLYHFSSL